MPLRDAFTSTLSADSGDFRASINRAAASGADMLYWIGYDVERSREGASTRDAKLAERRLIKLRAQQTEVVGFQERLQSLADRQIKLDLDDGVAYNYTLFRGLLYEGADLKVR